MFDWLEFNPQRLLRADVIVLFVLFVIFFVLFIFSRKMAEIVTIKQKEQNKQEKDYTLTLKAIFGAGILIVAFALVILL
ncbi:MAG: hypothetical protein RR416_02485 [Clostridia bacterium]